MTAVGPEGIRPPESPLAGRRVLVVGGAGRLAEALARAARDQGAYVAAVTVDPESGEIDLEHGFDRGLSALGAADSIIATIPTRNRPPADECSLAQWDLAVSTSLRRSFWIARRAVEGFLGEGKTGRLVLVAEPVDGLEATSPVLEGALRSLAGSFAREYGRRSLSCNVVVGAIDGEGAHARLAEQAVFLASPDASFVNGELLRVHS